MRRKGERSKWLSYVSKQGRVVSKWKTRNATPTLVFSQLATRPRLISLISFSRHPFHIPPPPPPTHPLSAKCSGAQSSSPGGVTRGFGTGESEPSIRLPFFARRVCRSFPLTFPMGSVRGTLQNPLSLTEFPFQPPELSPEWPRDSFLVFFLTFIYF